MLNANGWLAALDADWRQGRADNGEGTDVTERLFQGALDDQAYDAEPMSEGEREGQATQKEVAGSSPPPARSRSTILDTATLASLYVQQGFFNQAIDVYECLLTRDPHNVELADGLEVARRCAEGSRGEAAAPVRGDGARVPQPESVAEFSDVDGTSVTLRRQSGDALRSKESGPTDQTPSVTSEPGGSKERSRWLARFEKDGD